MKVKITCTANRTLPLETLEKFQPDSFKEYSEESSNKLKSSILKYGFFIPVCCRKGTNKILDGHSRVRVLKEMKEDGYNIPEIPIQDIEAKDDKEAAEKVLIFNSRYAKILPEGMQNFLQEFDLKLEDISNSVVIEDYSIPISSVSVENNLPIHLYREGFDDKWAFDINVLGLNGTEEIQDVLKRIFIYCNIDTPPIIQPSFI